MQLRFRNAVIEGDGSPLASMLIGGSDPAKRLTIHQRNYETSLVDALLLKFPAITWLIGTSFLTEVARSFVRASPPQSPCIAEYGAAFPDFLSSFAGAECIPYLRDFAELEWCVGQVAIAVDAPRIPAEALMSVSAEVLPDTRLTLQSGLGYVNASWPVDNLLQLYLTETAPDRLELAPADLWIEVRGGRGEFYFNRLDHAGFTFRKSISEGRSIGEAAEIALATDTGFNPGEALAAVVTDGLVIAVAHGAEGHIS